MFRTFTSVRRQSGVTLIGLLFWAVLLSSVALVAMKVFPAVTEYRTILTMVNKIADSGGTTVPEIRKAFERATAVEYGVTSITSKDLDAYRFLIIKNVKFLAAFNGITYQPFTADELGVHQVGPVLLAKRTERRIAHVLHGGQEQRELRELDGADARHAPQK